MNLALIRLSASNTMDTNIKRTDAIFLQPIAVEDLKAIYGRIAVFPMVKNGKTFRFVRKVEDGEKPGAFVAYVSRKLDDSKPKHVAQMVVTDPVTGETKPIRILCNVAESNSQMDYEL